MQNSLVCLRRVLAFVSLNFGHVVYKWRPQGDLNPCYRRERAVS